MKEPDNKRPLSYVLFKKFGIRGAFRILKDDVGFDLRHRVNTAAPMSQRRLFGKVYHQEQHRYVASTFHVVRTTFNYASRTLDLSECGLVDIGSGKGKVLITASRYPFRSLRGIELSNGINTIAKRNIQRLKLEQRIDLVQVSATDYDFQAHERLIYFFISFSGSLLDAFLIRLLHAPRVGPGMLIYVNPTQRHQVEAYFPCIRTDFISPGNCEVSYFALQQTCQAKKSY